MLATNPNMTGEATASFLADRLRGRVRVTRFASGLPVGGDLEYADEVTLGRALSGRREMWRDSPFEPPRSSTLPSGSLPLLGTWDRLYGALHLPLAHEPFYAQIGGAFVVGMAYLLWRAHRHASLEQGVALGAGDRSRARRGGGDRMAARDGFKRPQPFRDNADAARGRLRRPVAPGLRDCQAGRGSAAPRELTAVPLFPAEPLQGESTCEVRRRSAAPRSRR